jgi:hypothetical protein
MSGTDEPQGLKDSRALIYHSEQNQEEMEFGHLKGGRSSRNG